MRSASERAGFVCMFFALRGAPCGDDADTTLSRLGGHHCNEPATVAEPNGQEALLYVGVVEIETGDRFRVPERGPRFLEADAVFSAIDAFLSSVPKVTYHGAHDIERL